MKALPFQFEWDEAKADANARKHGVTFEVASTVFHDPRLLTVADLEHSDTEERWFSVDAPAMVWCCPSRTFGPAPTPPPPTSG